MIRQRTRSDHEFPDLGQMLTWQLCWKHTPMLVDDRRGNCEWGPHRDQPPAGTSRSRPGLAARHWPPDAARLPWVASAYPQ